MIYTITVETDHPDSVEILYDMCDDLAVALNGHEYTVSSSNGDFWGGFKEET